MRDLGISPARGLATGFLQPEICQLRSLPYDNECERGSGCAKADGRYSPDSRQWKPRGVRGASSKTDNKKTKIDKILTVPVREEQQPETEREETEDVRFHPKRNDSRGQPEREAREGDKNRKELRNTHFAPYKRLRERQRKEGNDAKEREKKSRKLGAMGEGCSHDDYGIEVPFCLLCPPSSSSCTHWKTFPFLPRSTGSHSMILRPTLSSASTRLSSPYLKRMDAQCLMPPNDEQRRGRLAYPRARLAIPQNLA